VLFVGHETIDLPEPEPTGPIKDQMYKCRGETVSIGAALEWIIHRLADEYVGPADRDRPTARRWDDLKRYLVARELTGRLQPQLQAVAEYFTARNAAAHAPTVVVQVGESTQILRLYYGGLTTRVDPIAIEDLRSEAAQARAGYKAAQAVGRAVDGDRPAVRAGLGHVARTILFDQV
jgi:hypothetical protein